MKHTNPYNKKSPWPTVDAMRQIYEMKLWGTGESQFYSGEGSHNPSIVKPYLQAIISFFKSLENPPVVCDFGCGDFNVAKQLVQHTKKYIAIDIVPELIDHNKQAFQNEKLAFYCLDISKDDLPTGDCAILRQVLQHLSNGEVQAVLNKLNHFKYIILTEHIPTGDFTPNKDIVSGQGIRLKKQSGLDILAPPFEFNVKGKKQLVAHHLKNGKGMIVTTLYEPL